MTIAELTEQYESLRALLLGSELGVSIVLPGSIIAEASFDAFVSSGYVALRETLADDVTFLRRAGGLGSPAALQTIYLLRTARQHTDNETAVQFYASWVGPEPINWSAAASRLAAEIAAFFQDLIRSAQTVRRTAVLHEQWREAAAVSVASTFDGVCHDLGLSFRPVARTAKIRAIESRYRRERVSGSKHRVMTDFCLQEVLSETGPLPVNHGDLLDELGLLGSEDAAAAASLAYATARALPNLRGDDFSRKVSELWWSLVSN